jgi:hypothetical protein
VKWTSYFTLEKMSGEKGFALMMTNETQGPRPDWCCGVESIDWWDLGLASQNEKKGSPFSDVDGRFCAAGGN